MNTRQKALTTLFLPIAAGAIATAATAQAKPVTVQVHGNCGIATHCDANEGLKAPVDQAMDQFKFRLAGAASVIDLSTVKAFEFHPETLTGIFSVAGKGELKDQKAYFTVSCLPYKDPQHPNQKPIGCTTFTAAKSV